MANRGLAEAAARRRLAGVRGQGDDATLHVSPETALRLELGDVVSWPDAPYGWRVEGVILDETPRVRLTRAEHVPVTGLDGEVDWRPGEPIQPPGPPVVHILDLPPLPTGGAEGGPLAAVAGEPWRATEIFVGASAATMTPRARVLRPAGVGVTLSGLARGPLHRLHREGRLLVQVEGALLQSRSWPELASGANAIAISHPGGEWEVLQFLRAELASPEVYLLEGLLRGQLGTDGVIGDSAPAGAPVVVLDPDLARLEIGAAERGLPLMWRATTAGGPGPLAASEGAFVWRNLVARPWSPSHTRGCRLADGGFRLNWTRRARLGGDGWEGEPPLGEEAEFYRVDVLSGEALVRTWEVDRPQLVYGAAEIAADFPGGGPLEIGVEVRQGSAVFGWGVAARRTMWL